MINLSIAPQDIKVILPDEFLKTIKENGISYERFISMFHEGMNPSINISRIYAVITDTEEKTRVHLSTAPNAYAAGKIALYMYDYLCHCDGVRICNMVNIMTEIRKTLN